MSARQIRHPKGSYLIYAGLAGISASLGSVTGKLLKYELINSVVPEELVIIGGLLLIFVMIAFNTIGFALFAKALNKSTNSLEPTLVSSALNYSCSALAGFNLFEETASFLWCCGTILVLLGISLLSKEETKLKKQ